MNKPIKAALLSAFLFPGAGQFFLKRYFLGAGLASAAFLTIYLIISEAIDRARQIVEKIQSGEVQLEVTTIAELVSRQSIGTDSQQLTIATAILTISWLVGIVDSFRVGRVQKNTPKEVGHSGVDQVKES